MIEIHNISGEKAEGSGSTEFLLQEVLEENRKLAARSMDTDAEKKALKLQLQTCDDELQRLEKISSARDKEIEQLVSGVREHEKAEKWVRELFVQMTSTIGQLKATVKNMVANHQAITEEKARCESLNRSTDESLKSLQQEFQSQTFCLAALQQQMCDCEQSAKRLSEEKSLLQSLVETLTGHMIAQQQFVNAVPQHSDEKLALKWQEGLSQLKASSDLPPMVPQSTTDQRKPIPNDTLCCENLALKLALNAVETRCKATTERVVELEREKIALKAETDLIRDNLATVTDKWMTADFLLESSKGTIAALQQRCVAQREALFKSEGQLNELQMKLTKERQLKDEAAAQLIVYRKKCSSNQKLLHSTAAASLSSSATETPTSPNVQPEDSPSRSANSTLAARPAYPFPQHFIPLKRGIPPPPSTTPAPPTVLKAVCQPQLVPLEMDSSPNFDPKEWVSIEEGASPFPDPPLASATTASLRAVANEEVCASCGRACFQPMFTCTMCKSAFHISCAGEWREQPGKNWCCERCLPPQRKRRKLLTAVEDID